MLTTSEFIECLDRGEIPSWPPASLRRRSLEDFQAREEITSRGMWALVYQEFARELAHWIGDRKVLEVMAGRGWLAKALSEEGIEVAATDDNSWDDRHSKAVPVFPVVEMEAVKAIEKMGDDYDVLLMSWPPYGDKVAYECLRTWGPDRPVIYIGEGYGGCNAPDSFFQHWREVSGQRIPMAQWDGLHDCVEIGYYVEEGHHICPECGSWSSEGELCWQCE